MATAANLAGTVRRGLREKIEVAIVAARADRAGMIVVQVVVRVVVVKAEPDTKDGMKAGPVAGADGPSRDSPRLSLRS
jgi:hypothetical protein